MHIIENNSCLLWWHLHSPHKSSCEYYYYKGQLSLSNKHVMLKIK